MSTSISRYGVPYLMQDPEIKKRAVDSLKLYREEHPEEFSQTRSFRIKYQR